MGKFRIAYPDGRIKWVKAIDTVNGTIEFTENSDEAYIRSGDYYSKAEGEFIKFNFKDHDEVKYLEVVCDYEGVYVP